LTSAWIADWLLDPQAHRTDASMPSLLSEDETLARREAADLVAYLETLPPAPGAEVSTAEGMTGSASDIEAGLELYEALSCIACHRFSAAHIEDEFDRVSLHEIAWKFDLGKLAEFLQEPGRHHSSTSMPDFNLNHEEAGYLAAYVIDHS
jgi:mono/diheme cytochrome c family protein